jgi:hypothetical protein
VGPSSGTELEHERNAIALDDGVHRTDQRQLHHEAGYGVCGRDREGKLDADHSVSHMLPSTGDALGLALARANGYAHLQRRYWQCWAI